MFITVINKAHVYSTQEKNSILKNFHFLFPFRFRVAKSAIKLSLMFTVYSAT